MKTLQKAFRFSIGEWKRQLSSKKIFVVFLCMAILLCIYSGDTLTELKSSDMSIGILELFPLYWNGSVLPDLLFGGFLLLVCDVPSRGVGMRNHVMRSGRKAYYIGELLYTAEMTICYLILIWILTVAFVVPNVTFSLEWSEGIQNGKIGLSSVFTATESYLYFGTPAGRFFSCIFIVGLCCFFMASLCSVINMATGSGIGCSACAFLLLLDIFFSQPGGLLHSTAYPLWIYFFSPITTIQVFSGEISCPLWIAFLYYIALSAIMIIFGAVAIKKSNI